MFKVIGAGSWSVVTADGVCRGVCDDGEPRIQPIVIKSNSLVSDLAETGRVRLRVHINKRIQYLSRQLRTNSSPALRSLLLFKYSYGSPPLDILYHIVHRIPRQIRHHIEEPHNVRVVI